MDQQPQQHQQLHGVVIVSLPPPDNPSKGKTITAFTYSDPQSRPTHHDNDLIPTRSLPPSPPPPPPARRRRLRFPKRILAALLGAVLVTLALWTGLFSEAPLQLLREPAEDGGRRPNEANSFLLPLYSKSRIGDRTMVTELKMASSAKIGGGVELQTGKRLKMDSTATVNSTAVLPLRGNVVLDGQYYTSILIGDPPRPYFLDVDTGSDLTWIQCDAPCTSCAKGPHPLYKPSKGKIVLPKDSLCLEVQSSQSSGSCESCQQCDYEIEYADHSSSMGVLARDDTQLVVANGSPMKLNFVFGCAYDQQGQLLAAKTDGILGLSSARASLPSQLSSQGIINNVVGHCISSEADVGGYMFLGDDFVPRWGMTWVPTLGGLIFVHYLDYITFGIVSPPRNFYNTEVSKISYGEQQIGVWDQRRNAGQVVFDTGSTYTYFTNEAYTNLITSLKYVSRVLAQDDSDPSLPVCWRANLPIRSVEDVKQLFEPLTLQFGKRWWFMPTELTIPPEGYLLINSKGNVCLGVLNGSEILDGSMIILGDVSLRGKLVVYDNVQQRIGWVQSDCAKAQRPKGFPFFF